MPSLIAAIQDAVPVSEVDARTVLHPAPELIITEPESAASEVLEPFGADVTVRAAPSYALLTVQRIDDGHFRLVGQHREDENAMPIGEPRGRPYLSLGELATGPGLSPEDLYDMMLEWSAGEERFIEWLQRLRAAVGDDELRLIIWDTTGFDIPWELFYVPASEIPQRREGPLGGLFAVSRRVTAYRTADDGSPYTEHVCRGRLLAFVDDQMAEDRQFLNRYAAGAIDRPDKLLDQLNEAPDPLGLVYVACHGLYADGLPGLRLGTFKYFQIPVIRWLLSRGHGRWCSSMHVTLVDCCGTRASIVRPPASQVPFCGRVPTSLSDRLDSSRPGSLAASLLGYSTRSPRSLTKPLRPR